MDRFLLLISLLISISSFSQKKDEPQKYCSNLKNGVMTLMQNGKIITSAVVLNDGSRISEAGSVTRTDGSTTILKNGECINSNGIIESVPSENTIQTTDRSKKSKNQITK